MASELEGSRRKTFQNGFPSLAKSGMNTTVTPNRDAASGRVERPKNCALQDAPVHLNEFAAKDTAFIRTTERGALGPFRAATRTGAGNPFRSECACKRSGRRGVEVHVVMRIGMRRYEATLFHPADLRAKFAFDFCGRRLPRPKPACHLMWRVKRPTALDERLHLARGQNGPSLADIEVNAESEARKITSTGNRVLCGGHVHHQRCAAEEAIAVRHDDPVGDAAAHSEIVGVDDQSNLSHRAAPG